ncbi:MAG: membrane protein insertase YidC, partial [Oscillospiraceae bacterium]|nr:membrane protein insertase YidC [Oscillospiraceae bacterium]
MMEIIKVPFGYLLDWLCRFSGNYGIALILFSLIIKVILLPLSAKSKKSTLKMSRLAPQMKLLEIQCGEDKQRYQQEMAKLYKEEGVSMFGGCLWSFIPLLILIPLYYVIREPFTYLMHFTKEEAQEIVKIIGQSVAFTSNQFYQELEAASYVGQCRDAIVAAIPSAADKLREYNFMLW